MVKLYNGDIELLRVEDIAKKMKCHNLTIRRYIRAGKLKAQRIGRRYYISKESFREFVNGGK